MCASCIRTLAIHSSTTSSATKTAEMARIETTLTKPAGARSAPVSKPLAPEGGNEQTVNQQKDVVVTGLAKQFGETPIFAGVDFSIAHGEAAAVVGANGTGKSTLLRCILGLIPPTTGDIQLLGEDVVTAKPAMLRRLRAQTGLVAQKHNLVPRLSVLSNVIHGLLGTQSGPRYWSQTFAPRDAREAAMDALEKVGLAHLATRRADRLSGGQSQRVAIARALIAQPRLLIADEPCASLDPAAGEEVMDLFFHLVR